MTSCMALFSRLSGKIATGGQVVALLMLFATQQRRPVWVMIAAVLSVWSAIDYTFSAYRTWSQDRDPQL